MIKEMIPVSMGDSYKRKRIVGTNHDYIRLFSGKLKEGVLFEKPLEATIGNVVASELGLKVGDEFVGGHGMEEVLHSHDEYKYKVVGVLERSGSVLDNLILTPVQTVWIMHAGHNDDSEYTLEELKKQLTMNMNMHTKRFLKTACLKNMRNIIITITIIMNMPK